MHRRRAGAAGRRDRHADVPPNDADTHIPPEAASFDHLELVDLDAGLQATESMQRRLGDLQLRDALAAQDFAGPAWEAFAQELARYGHAVILGWLHTGLIFSLSRTRRRPVGSAPTSWTEDDRVDLATDTVVKGIALFHERALVRGEWSVEGGASLSTYFIGSCILVFPGIYRAWRSEHEQKLRIRSAGHAADLDGAGKPLGPAADDPAEVAARWTEIAEGLDALPDERTRVIVAASAFGYSHGEIAELLSAESYESVTSNNVAQILFRHKRRATRGAHTHD